jgi:hypothetical protein
MTWKLPLALVASGSVCALIAITVAARDDIRPAPAANASPDYGVTLPPGYRSWEVVSVAHEAGNNNDIRVILGNAIAMKAYRSGTLPFPDGSILARIAWKYVPSERNNAIFGREQSFVAGDPTNVQIDVKDSRRYASSGGWGYGQFENGKANPSETLIHTCVACHQRLPPEADLVFTTYSP